MNRVDVNNVLMQMRQVKDQIRSQQEQSSSKAQALKPQNIQKSEADRNQITGDHTVPDFQNMLTSAINTVNENQKASAALAQRFEQGDPGIDLPEVMIAMQKSSVSFQAMTQVRNKLVEAYKDVMNMPV